MSLRLQEGCTSSCYPCTLRASCVIIATTNLVWMAAGVAISPELLKEFEFIITFGVTIAAHVVLMLAAIFEIEVLLLIWFGYAVEFLMGFPLRIESIIGYYRKIYEPYTRGYPSVVYILEFVIIKCTFIYFIRIVCSYYLQLQDSKPITIRDTTIRMQPSAFSFKHRAEDHFI